MTKYLRVDIERGLAGQDVTEYHQLEGDETNKDLEEIAADVLANYCSYGHSIVDESDVPANQR